MAGFDPSTEARRAPNEALDGLPRPLGGLQADVRLGRGPGGGRQQDVAAARQRGAPAHQRAAVQFRELGAGHPAGAKPVDEVRAVLGDDADPFPSWCNRKRFPHFEGRPM